LTTVTSFVNAKFTAQELDLMLYLGQHRQMVRVHKNVSTVLERCPPGQVVIRIHFTDYIGKVMFHCHISAHEDAGMMSFINVVEPPSGYPQSLITP
jgi:hypothetical protein